MQIDGSKVDKKSYIQLQISLVTIFQGKVLAQSLYIKYQILEQVRYFHAQPVC